MVLFVEDNLHFWMGVWSRKNLTLIFLWNQILTIPYYYISSALQIAFKNKEVTKGQSKVDTSDFTTHPTRRLLQKKCNLLRSQLLLNKIAWWTEMCTIFHQIKNINKSVFCIMHLTRSNSSWVSNSTVLSYYYLFIVFFY